MKKFLSLTLALLLLLGVLGISTFAATDPLSAEVYVTIANAGTLVVSQEKITVTDIDSDNALTINDALYAAHEAKYTGGAAAGYASADSAWGLSLTRLWGDSSGNFAYYLNDASVATDLTEQVESGDHVNAFIYSDTQSYSDTYCYFDVKDVTGAEESTVILTLTAVGWTDTSPVAGATITIDGEPTAYVTDAEGKVTVTLANVGTHVISAASEDAVLVPPVCKVTVTAKAQAPVADDSTDGSDDAAENGTGDTQEPEEEKSYTVLIVCIVGGVVTLAAGAVAFVVIKRKRNT